MSWEEILMDAGIAAIVVGVIRVIGTVIKIVYDSKKGTEKLQNDHVDLKSGQGSIKEMVKDSQAAINNVDKMLLESKINQRRNFESLSKDQKELKEHMDKFQALLSDWERQANIIRELEHIKEQLMDKNNSLEKQIDIIYEEIKKLDKENAELKEKINDREYITGRKSINDIFKSIEEIRSENDFEHSDRHKDRDRER